MLDFRSILDSCAWKAANGRGRMQENVTSRMRFLLLGRKRDYEVKNWVIKLRGLDLTQILKEKTTRTSPSLAIQKTMATYKQPAKRNIQSHPFGAF